MLYYYVRSIALRKASVITRRHWINSRLYHADKFPNCSQWIESKPSVILNSPISKNTQTVIDPKIALSGSSIRPSSIYNTDKEFQKTLDNALFSLYNKHLVGCSNDRRSFTMSTWQKLRTYLHDQLNTRIDRNPGNFTWSLSKLVSLNDPSNLISQLLSVQTIPTNVWRHILKSKEDSVSDLEKFNYIIKNTFDYIYNQEVIPSMVDPITYKINISNPSEWFPEARKLRRNIIVHIGPTNSGKTYRALQKLKNVNRGYYAGPLRLLAREVYERFKNEGVRCNLLTGEEVINDVDEMGNPAGLTSGTIEMVPLNREFDVAVFDEIQMMSDPERGWAWTNALLGVQAKEVHLCGEERALPVIQEIVKITGDNLFINKYKRLGELIVEKQSIRKNLKLLKKGDCVVAFSKKRILDLKLRIEKETNLKVAVIYGSLPPETRIQQAASFNKGFYDIVVASDAIGMGLNLAINRIVFTTDMKFNGKEMVELSTSNVKQIGGRAGRFDPNKSKSQGAKGYITATDRTILKSIRNKMNEPNTNLTSCVVWPPDELCSQIMMESPPGTLPSEVLIKIGTSLESKFNKLFSLCDLSNKIGTLQIFEKMKDIPFNDKLRLSNAPVKRDLPLVKEVFGWFCDTISKGQTRNLLSYTLPFDVLDYKCINDDNFNLEIYESMYNIFTLFFWLSNRYPNYFVDLESVKEMRVFCEMITFEKLDRLKRNPYAYQRGAKSSVLSIKNTLQSKRHR